MQALAVQTKTAKTSKPLNIPPSVNEYEVIEGGNGYAVEEEQHRTRDIGIENGWYILYFCMVGQIVKDDYGEIRKNYRRFPKSADVAIDTFLGMTTLNSENSHLAKLTGTGSNQHYVEVQQKQKVPTDEKVLTLQTSSQNTTVSGKQMSLFDL